MNADLKMQLQSSEMSPKHCQAKAKEDRLIFPLDLSEWMAKESILETITALIETFNWGNPELIKYLQSHSNYRPKMLLRLLCFAYATGVFAAKEIESSSFSDPFLRSTCESDPPQARDISRFRRNNRGLLKWLLAQLLKEVLKQKFALGERILPAGLRRFLMEAAVERLDLARHLDGVGDEG
jgi:hypothetical protein